MGNLKDKFSYIRTISGSLYVNDIIIELKKLLQIEITIRPKSGFSTSGNKKRN